MLLTYTLVCTFRVIISFFDSFLGWFEKANYQSSISVDYFMLKFIYSEKATKFCEIFPLLLTTVHTVKSKGKISQNFVVFSEYMNFI